MGAIDAGRRGSTGDLTLLDHKGLRHILGAEPRTTDFTRFLPAMHSDHDDSIGYQNPMESFAHSLLRFQSNGNVV